MPQSRPLILSAFMMNTTSHILGGAWRQPDAQQHRFNELQHWVELAKILEDGGFDIAFSPMSWASTGITKAAGHRTSAAACKSQPDPLVLSALAATTQPHRAGTDLIGDPNPPVYLRPPALYPGSSDRRKSRVERGYFRTGKLAPQLWRPRPVGTQ